MVVGAQNSFFWLSSDQQSIAVYVQRVLVSNGYGYGSVDYKHGVFFLVKFSIAAFDNGIVQGIGNDDISGTGSKGFFSIAVNAVAFNDAVVVMDFGILNQP